MTLLQLWLPDEQGDVWCVCSNLLADDPPLEVQVASMLNRDTEDWGLQADTWLVVLNRDRWCGLDPFGDAFRNAKPKDWDLALPFAWKWQAPETLLGRPVSAFVSQTHQCTHNHTNQPDLVVAVAYSKNTPPGPLLPLDRQAADLFASPNPSEFAKLNQSAADYQEEWYGVANPTQHPTAPSRTTLPLIFRSDECYNLYETLRRITRYEEDDLVKYMESHCTREQIRKLEDVAHSITLEARTCVAPNTTEEGFRARISAQLAQIFRDNSVRRSPDPSQYNTPKTGIFELKGYHTDGCAKFQAFCSASRAITKQSQDHTTRFLLLHAIRGSDWIVGCQVRDNTVIKARPDYPSFIADFIFQFSLLPMHAYDERDRIHNLRLSAFLTAISIAQTQLAKQYDDGAEMKDVLAPRLLERIRILVRSKEEQVDEESKLRCVGTVKREPFVLILEGGRKKYAVKFLRGRYGETSHKEMCRAGFAPHLYGVEALVDGWKMAVMDHVDGISAAEPNAEPTDSHLQQLEKLRDELAKRNIVHGDIRRANIILSRNSLQLIDWDWAGQAGLDRYPYVQLRRDEAVSPEQLGGEPMEHEHDLGRINALLERWDQKSLKRKASQQLDGTSESEGANPGKS
ncbi:Protein kinase-like domain [Mycena kentingensis (nom. inval.)]|nr:Protein kinase-like domain [Mycena kentingensis (nom. inval.)]